MADIDADMGDAALIGITEEDEIAWSELVAADRLAGIVLFYSRARKIDPGGTAQDITGKTGAVKTGPGRSAHHIARSLEGVGSADDATACQSTMLLLVFRNVQAMAGFDCRHTPLMRGAQIREVGFVTGMQGREMRVVFSDLGKPLLMATLSGSQVGILRAVVGLVALRLDPGKPRLMLGARLG